MDCLVNRQENDSKRMKKIILLMSLLLVLINIVNASLDDNLVLYMPFDNEEKFQYGITLDISSANNDGTLAGYTFNHGRIYGNASLLVNKSDDANVDTCTGDWDSTNTCAKAIDGDFSTYGGAEDGFSDKYAYVYRTYIKPESDFALWEVRDGGAKINITIASQCFNQVIIQLQAESHHDVDHVKWKCYNGTGWHILRTDTTNERVYDGQLYFFNSTTIGEEYGYYNKGIYFDGVDDYILLDDNDKINNPALKSLANTSFTIMAWIKRDSATGDYSIYDYGTNTFVQWFYSDDSGRIYCHTARTTGNYTTAYSNTGTSSAGVWRHVACVFNGSLGVLGQNTVYVSGVENTAVRTTPIYIDGNYSASTTNISLGIESGRNAYDFNGSMDEVRIWNIPLTESEIALEMNSSNPVKGEHLIASYSFELHNSTHVYDTNNIVDGQFDGGQYFDGTDDYINVTYNTTINTTSLWFKNGTTWNHYINNSGIYYVDGTNVSKFTYPITYTGDTIIIGKTTVSVFWNGSIDDVMIFNKSLSSKEVYDLYYSQRLDKLNAVSDYIEFTTNINISKNLTIPRYSSALLSMIDIENARSASASFLRVGDTKVWSKASTSDGKFSSYNLTDSINVALNGGLCNCLGCYLIGNNCSIPFWYNNGADSIIAFDNFYLVYHEQIYRPDTELITPENNTHHYAETIEINVTSINSSACYYSIDGGDYTALTEISEDTYSDYVTVWSGFYEHTIELRINCTHNVSEDPFMSDLYFINIINDLFISLFDFDTNEIINGTTMAIQLVGPDYSNGTLTTNGTTYNKIPDFNGSIDLSLRAFSNDILDYSIVIHEITLTDGVDSSAWNITLINTSDTTKTKYVALHVIDENSQSVEGALITILQQNPATGSFFTLTELTTNPSGSATTLFVVDTVFYKFLVNYQGNRVYTSSGVISISPDDDDIFLPAILGTPYTDFYDTVINVNVGLAWNEVSNSSGNFSMTYSGSSLVDICFNVSKVNMTGVFPVYGQCESGTDGSMESNLITACNVTLYRADVYGDLRDGYGYRHLKDLAEYVGIGYEDKTGTEGFIFPIIAIVLSAFGFMANAVAGIIMLIIAFVSIFLFKITLINANALMLIVSLSLFTLFTISTVKTS